MNKKELEVGQGTADCVKTISENYLPPLTPIINFIIGNRYIKIG